MASKVSAGEKLSQEILDYLKNHPVEKYSEAEGALAREIDAKIIDLIKSIPLGQLSTNSEQLLDEYYFENGGFSFYHEICFWNEYKQLNHYIQASDVEKPKLLEQLKIDLLKRRSRILMSPGFLDKTFVRSIYGSHCPELIQMFEEIFPLPPLSFFDSEHQPMAVVKRAAERASVLAKFDARNAGDRSVEEKIQNCQRLIRAKIRTKSEVKRIGERYFKDAPTETKEAKAREIIKDANTPYKPRGCSPDLAQRILKAASRIRLFDSATHLLDAHNIALILDNCLYGRQYLVDSYMPFRPAALDPEDIKNGDGNVICFGPDRIDPRCLRDRTIGLELDLDVLTSQDKFKKNPTLFFKQRDLGFDINTRQSVQIGKTALIFSHTGLLRNPSNNCVSLQLYDDMGSPLSHFGEARKDLLISSNIKQMHQILTLNFFRFIDNLKNENSVSAPGITQQIYTAISSLKTDQEMESFLLNLGKKMSCSSEINIHGAYKIDLNALRSITIYEDKLRIESISINDLCNKLNDGNFETLDRLEKLVPEIFRSIRFVDHLRSKVKNKAALEKLIGLGPVR